jgi:hypothetical protein
MGVGLFISSSQVARADSLGADLLLLAEIVTNTTQQLLQLRQILGAGRDTLNMMRDINKGLKDALDLGRATNVHFNPGVLSNLGNVQEAMGAVEKLYGRVPNTPQAEVQKTTDQSVAEAIEMHNDAFRYADQIEPQAEQIKDRSKVVNPQGAGKLTAESLGVVVDVMNKVLRTNAAMLKLQGEQLALLNRKEKLASEQFRTQYDGISRALGNVKPAYDLPDLSR